MTLPAAVQQYIDWKRAAGARFVTEAHVLRRYARTVGEAVNSDAVSDAQALAFLVGGGPLTANRGVKRSALNGFYRYALGRGLATRSPLPADEPRRPAATPPYIYSRAELRRLLHGVEASRQGARQLDAATFRALLLVLYGAGLRLGEALRLTRGDVDLEQALLAVRETKLQDAARALGRTPRPDARRLPYGTRYRQRASGGHPALLRQPRRDAARVHHGARRGREAAPGGRCPAHGRSPLSAAPA